MRDFHSWTMVLMVGLASTQALAQAAKTYVYPQKGQSKDQQAQDEAAHQAGQQETQMSFQRAFAACKEGRGYTVKQTWRDGPHQAEA